jgi:hypothetical protein
MAIIGATGGNACSACMSEEFKELVINALEFVIKDLKLDYHWLGANRGEHSEPKPGTPTAIAVNTYTNLINEVKKIPVCGIESSAAKRANAQAFIEAAHKTGGRDE